MDKRVKELTQQWQQELVSLYTLVGAKTTADLKQVPLLLSGENKTWCEARGIDFTKYSQRSPNCGFFSG